MYGLKEFPIKEGITEDELDFLEEELAENFNPDNKLYIRTYINETDYIETEDLCYLSFYVDEERNNIILTYTINYENSIYKNGVCSFTEEWVCLDKQLAIEKHYEIVEKYLTN